MRCRGETRAGAIVGGSEAFITLTVRNRRNDAPQAPSSYGAACFQPDPGDLFTKSSSALGASFINPERCTEHGEDLISTAHTSEWALKRKHGGVVDLGRERGAAIIDQHHLEA